jgi:hypothetical protein
MQMSDTGCECGITRDMPGQKMQFAGLDAHLPVTGKPINNDNNLSNWSTRK